jgi:hypothetical protein
VAVDVARNRPGHPGPRIDTVELGGLDQRGEHGPVAGTTIGAGEQVVLATKRDRPHRPLDCVVVDLEVTVVEEAHEAGPAESA